ncbi:MAG: hypothetical protein H7834_06165 [Magnetococcus sp. YQC-9]
MWVAQFYAIESLILVVASISAYSYKRWSIILSTLIIVEAAKLIIFTINWLLTALFSKSLFYDVRLSDGRLVTFRGFFFIVGLLGLLWYIYYYLPSVNDFKAFDLVLKLFLGLLLLLWEKMMVFVNGKNH